MTTFSGESVRVAEEMGIAEHLRALACRQDRQVLHDRSGRIIRTFDLQSAHERQGGTLTLRRSDWHRVLRDAVPDRVPIRLAATVRS